MSKYNPDFAGAKNVPTGVKVVSVLFYIGFFLFLVSGILSIGGVGLPEENITGAAVGVPQLGRGFEIVSGVISVALAVFVFFVGMGLWKGRRWSWLSSIIIAGLGIFISLISMLGGRVIGNLIVLLIYAVIGGYLLFNESARKVFS